MVHVHTCVWWGQKSNANDLPRRWRSRLAAAQKPPPHTHLVVAQPQAAIRQGEGEDVVEEGLGAWVALGGGKHLGGEGGGGGGGQEGRR